MTVRPVSRGTPVATVLVYKSINSYDYNKHGPNFDDMSSFFPCDAIQYINLGYRAQAPKIVIL